MEKSYGKTHNQEESKNKEECYYVKELEGKTKFICKICEQILSSKYRIFTHLSRIHNMSPLKRIKKKYVDDPSLPIPKRTLLWQKAKEEEARCAIASHDGISNEPEMFSSNISNALEEQYDEKENNNSNLTFSEQPHDESNIVYMDKLLQIAGSSKLQEIQPTSFLYYHSTSDGYSSGESDDNFSSGSFESDESYTSSSEEYVSTDTDNEQTDEMSSECKDHELSDFELKSMCLISYVIRHNLTGAAGEDLLSLLKLFCPSDKDILNCSYKTMIEKVSKGKSKCIHYCSICNSIFPDDENVFECQTADCTGLRYKGKRAAQTKSSRRPVSFFMLADVKYQLNQLLNNKSLWKSLLQTKDYVHSTMQIFNNDEVIHDITDGQSYRNLNLPGGFLSDRYAFSGVFNTDGVPLFSSSKEKLWPIFIAINELPVSLRFCRENLLLSGIWQGKHNPPFFQYISAFGQEMADLYYNGLSVGGINVKFGMLVQTLDLQAKSYVTNMTMHNGAFGCITCVEEGKTVKQGKGTSRCYPYRTDEELNMREHDSFVANSMIATRTSRIKGICGPSGLMAMSWYDIIIGTVPDYMHGTLLGVTKMLLQKHLSPKNAGKPYFVGKQITKISKRMLSIKPPDFIERAPRDLEKNYQNFKATELQSWLLYYSLPCLEGYLPDKYLRHLALLSEGIYILLSDNITSSDLIRAKGFLEQFYKDFAGLYGEGSSGLNLHNIGKHLAFYVQQWGPLFAWSCFGFEDANANILSFAHGTRDVTRQILNMKESHMTINATTVKSNTVYSNYLKKMNKRFSKKWSNLKTLKECCAAGASKQFVLPEHCSEELIRISCSALDITELKTFYRIEYNNEKYYGSAYGKMKTKTGHVALCSGGEIAEIIFFIWNTTTDDIYAYANKLELSESVFMFENEGHHCMQVQRSNDIIILPINKLKEKLFFMEVGKKFVARVPNVYGRGVIK